MNRANATQSQQKFWPEDTLPVRGRRPAAFWATSFSLKTIRPQTRLLRSSSFPSQTTNTNIPALRRTEAAHGLPTMWFFPVSAKSPPNQADFVSPSNGRRIPNSSTPSGVDVQHPPPPRHVPSICTGRPEQLIGKCPFNNANRAITMAPLACLTRSGVPDSTDPPLTVRRAKKKM